MAQRSDEKRKKSARRIKVPVWFLIVAGVTTVLMASAALLQVVYAGRISPGVTFAGHSLAGEKTADAVAFVRTSLATAEGEGVKLKFGDKQLVAEYTVADTTGFGLTTDAVSFDIDATVQRVTSIGAKSGTGLSGFSRLRAAIFGLDVRPVVTVNDEALQRSLQSTLVAYEQPVIEAAYTVSGGEVSVTAPKGGRIFDYPQLVRSVRQYVQVLSADAITAELHDQAPAVSTSEAKTLISDVQKLIQRGSLTLHAGSKSVTVKPSTYIAWLTPVRKNTALSIAVSSDTIHSYLSDLLPQVSTVAKNAKFTFKDGVVTQIQGSSSGTELDVDASTSLVAAAMLKTSSDLQLTMRSVDPEATTATVANLGIKELVAVGQTNFAGSPSGRRHNIEVGSNLLNGLLIKPGDEFSLVKAIGPVDATLGYVQELVIKGNHTLPEFGGGLCQVATTMFRAVMNAGLPVIERTNHSYRVSYYEPPVGMDATIYEPKPDFRFKNDYGAYLLLQTRIEGNNLIFEFWGTKDTRMSAESTPKLSNIVPPPSPLTIESIDIPVGTTKCIEHAHNGSDAEFTYSVTKDGKKVDQLFTSHYKPWRQVCLVGVKKLSSGTPDTTGGSTNSNSNTNTSTNKNSSSNKNSSINTNTNTAVN